MPLYEYECNACRHRFELIQKFSDPPPEACTSCGTGPVRRLLSSPAIQFKGSGWYITDYARKGASSADSGSGGAKPAAPDTASGPGASETKTPSPGPSSGSKDA
jgi:putative FmdB family regulatory protein